MSIIISLKQLSQTIYIFEDLLIYIQSHYQHPIEYDKIFCCRWGYRLYILSFCQYFCYQVLINYENDNRMIDDLCASKKALSGAVPSFQYCLFISSHTICIILSIDNSFIQFSFKRFIFYDSVNIFICKCHHVNILGQYFLYFIDLLFSILNNKIYTIYNIIFMCNVIQNKNVICYTLMLCYIMISYVFSGL